VAGNRVIAAILSRTLGLTEIQKKLAETYRAKG
jgi:hypothetical protein